MFHSNKINKYIILLVLILYKNESCFCQISEWHFSSIGQISTQYTDFNGGNSEVAPFQMVCGLRSSVTIGSVPLTANLRYVTGDDSYSRSMNQVNLDFDINTFKQNLIQKAMERAEEMKDEIIDVDELTEDKLREKAIAKLKEKLGAPEAVKSLEELKDLENLEQALQNPAFQEKLGELSDLEDKYNIKSVEDIEALEDELPADVNKKLYQLYAMKEKYEKLKAQKERLEKLRGKYEKYKKMAEKLEQLENPSLATSLRDPTVLKEFLINSGGMSKMEKVMMSVDHISIGKSYPFYSRYTVNRVALTGVDVGVRPGIFLVSVLGGKSLHNIFDSEGRLSQYNRDLFGGKLGLGDGSGTHLHFSGFVVKDDPANALEQDSILTLPKSNILLGMDFGLHLFEGKLRLVGEAVGSAHNSSDFAPGLEEPYPDGTPQFVRGLFSPNFSTYVGTAYNLDFRAKLFDNATDLKLKYESIAAGFESLAAPVLLSDRLFYEIKLSQHLLSRQLQISLFHKQEQDNIIPWKAYQTTSNSSGIQMSFMGNKGLVIQGNYSPYFQRNDLGNEPVVDSSYMSNMYSMTNLSASWNYKLGEVQASTQLTMMMMWAEMNAAETTIPSSTQATTNFVFNQSITTSDGLSFNLNLSNINSLVELESEEESLNDLWILDFSGAFLILGKWNNSLGIQYANENSLDNKFGFYYRTTVPISQNFNLILSAKQNQFSDPLNPSLAYSDLYINGGLRFKF